MNVFNHEFNDKLVVGAFSALVGSVFAAIVIANLGLL
jgi:hypothetical protein